MPASRRSRARRRRRRQQLLPRMPVLEQHHRDLIGLGLVALAAFFACVFYLGWAGGEVGEAAADGILFLFGGVGYLTPIVLFAAGALLVLEPMLPSVKPFRSGAICLIFGLLLALGAGALGPERPGDGFITDAGELRRHGGLAGEGLYWIASTLFSDAGAHILFAFLLLAGVLLLTGGSVAGVLRVTRESVTATTQRVRRSTSEFAAVLSQTPTARVPERGEPPDVEPVVRATHVEMPVRDEAPEEPVKAPPEPDWDDPEGDDAEEGDPLAEPLPGENEPEPMADPDEMTPRASAARP